MRRLTLSLVSCLAVAAALLLTAGASAGAAGSPPELDRGDATTLTDYCEGGGDYQGDARKVRYSECGPVGCDQGSAGLARVIVDPCSGLGLGPIPGVVEGPPGDPNCGDTVDNDFDGFIDEADSNCQDPDGGVVPNPDGGVQPTGKDTCLAAEAKLAARQAVVDRLKEAVKNAGGPLVKEQKKLNLKRKRALRNSARGSMREACKG